jgi:hypothetical protein
VYTPGNFIATEYGPFPVPINTLTSIDSSITGFDSVTNLEVGVTGSYAETDEELRLRREESIHVIGATTNAAIYSRILQDVSGITEIKVVENETDYTTLDGLPPHSIEVVLDGGDTVEIANKLNEVKGGAITTYGSVKTIVTDDAGAQKAIFFSRFQLIPIYVTVQFKLYNRDIFPIDGLVQINQSIVDSGLSLRGGEDVISDKFKGPIFSNIKGIESLTILISRSTAPILPNRIPIKGREKPYIDGSFVTVVEVF